MEALCYAPFPSRIFPSRRLAYSPSEPFSSFCHSTSRCSSNKPNEYQSENSKRFCDNNGVLIKCEVKRASFSAVFTLPFANRSSGLSVPLGTT